MESLQAKTERLYREARIVRYLSVYLLLFFSWVFVAYSLRWDAPLVRVFWELLMIPSLIMLAVLPLFSIIRFIQAPGKSRRPFLMVLLLQALPIILMIILSTIE